MKRTKLAVVLEATLGGTRKHVLDVLSYLPCDVFDITFFYATTRADDSFLEALISLRQRNIRLVELPMKKSLFSLSNFRALAILAKQLRQEKYEVVHLHAAVAGVLGRLACIGNPWTKKIYYSPHGGALHHLKGLKGQLIKTAEKLLLFDNVRLIAVSAFEQKTIATHLCIPASRVKTIYNGIETNRKPVQANKSGMFSANNLPLNEEAFIVLFPAVFLPAKGHLNFFQQIIRNQVRLKKNVYLLLAGDGPLRQQVMDTVAKSEALAENVFFLGFRNDVASWISIADLVILPSKNEAFGYVILEAFLQRKPVFATCTGGIVDVIDHGTNGLLFECDRLEEMVNAINSHATRKHELRAMGEAGYQKLVAEFSMNKMIAQLETTYLS